MVIHPDLGDQHWSCLGPELRAEAELKKNRRCDVRPLIRGCLGCFKQLLTILGAWPVHLTHLRYFGQLICEKPSVAMTWPTGGCRSIGCLLQCENLTCWSIAGWILTYLVSVHRYVSVVFFRKMMGNEWSSDLMVMMNLHRFFIVAP